MDTAPAAPTTAVDTNRVGLATLIAGACFIVAALGSAVLDALWIAMVPGFALFVYAVRQLHLFQAPADGGTGLWGSRLVVFGGLVVLTLGIVYLIWEAIGDPPEDPAFVGILWMVGFLAFAIGVIAFGIGSVKAKVFPQAAPSLMLAGIVVGLAIDMATGAFFEEEGTTTPWGFYIGFAMFGAGVAWIGYWLWKSRTAINGGEPAPPG